MRKLPLFLLVLTMAACGGGSSNPSTGPSATATSVAVTLATPIIAVTKTTNATGTATLTNGQTQSVTTGWRSDVTTVATVSDGGVVTGVATGRANIYVVSGGRQGQAQIRVVPNYAGQWRGTYVVRSCTQSGVIVTANLCGQLGVGSVLPITMTLAQTADTATGQFLLGSLAYQTVTSSIGEDGRVQFTAGALGSLSGIVNATAWQFSSVTDGRITGVGVSIFRPESPAQTGEGTLALEIVDMTRVAGGLTSRFTAPLHLNTFSDALAALQGH